MTTKKSYINASTPISLPSPTNRCANGNPGGDYYLMAFRMVLNSGPYSGGIRCVYLSLPMSALLVFEIMESA